MQTFVISTNTFLTKLLEEFSKKLGVKLYTMDKIEESLFFIHDLETKLLVIDGQSLENLSDKFKLEWQNDTKVQSIPVILIGKQDNLALKMNVVEVLNKPTDAQALVKKIQSKFSH